MNLQDKPEVAHSGAQLLHPGSRILFRHWESVRAERPCPNRSDMDLRAVSKLMPWLAIVTTDQAEAAPTFKLAGTSVCDLFQSQLTGGLVGQSLDRFERRVVDETLQLSLQRLQPSLIRLRFISMQGSVTNVEFLALPVINTTLSQSQLFCGVFSFPEQSNSRNDTLYRIELVATRMIWTEHVESDQLLDQMVRPNPTALRVIQGGMSQR